MSKPRRAIESPLTQGEDEQIVYTVDTTNWGGSPTSPVAAVKGADGADVTSTVMPSGSASESGDIVTLPTLKLLTAGVVYRVEVKFTIGGNILECYFKVQAEI